MLNIEKYKDEIIEEALDDKFCSIAKLAQGDPGCFHQKDNCEDCVLNTVEWLLGEYKEPILTDSEREYLSSVIKPFRKNAYFVCKNSNILREYISIGLDNNDYISLPTFKPGEMYKCMEKNKLYALEELGL